MNIPFEMLQNVRILGVLHFQGRTHSKSEAVVVICILACFSWNAHRRLRRAQERTVSPDDGENGGPTSPVSLRSSPGLLAHGSYSFLLRGTLGSVFFVLAVLPLILVIVTWRRV